MEQKQLIKNIIREYLNEHHKTQINEGSSDILYHFTSQSNLLNILKNNEISLTAAIGSPSDFNINKNKFYYLSTTRSKSTGYKSGDVKIVLNGRKLKNNYKITPVDYWQWSKKRSDWRDENAYRQALTSSEQEDRIISDKSFILNAINYITEIHIYVNNPNPMLKEIIDVCQNNNIKLYLYDNQKNWLNQIKPIDKNINIDNVEDNNDYYSSRDYFEYDIAALIAYNDLNNYNLIKTYLGDEDKINKLNKTLKERTINNFKVGAIYFDDGLYSINNHITKIRTKPDKNSKFLLSLLVKEFKKYGVNNIKDYLIKKQFKDKKTLNDYKKELRQYLGTLMLNELHDGLDRNFNHYIEVDGNYYNHAYDSEELIKIVYEYINKINEYLNKEIFSEEQNIFEYNYRLDKDYIKKYIDFDNIKLSDKINITDSKEDINYIDALFKDLIKFYLIIPISNGYYDKIKELKTKYNEQFN